MLHGSTNSAQVVLRWRNHNTSHKPLRAHSLNVFGEPALPTQLRQTLLRRWWIKGTGGGFANEGPESLPPSLDGAPAVRCLV